MKTIVRTLILIAIVLVVRPFLPKKKVSHGDVLLTVKVTTIVDKYNTNGRNYKIVAYYDDFMDHLGYTQKIGDTFYVSFRHGYDTPEILHHEAAHILTWDEKAIHGKNWYTMMENMGYKSHARNYYY